MDDVARIDLADTGYAVNGCPDRGVAELSPGVVDARLVALDLGFKLGNERALRIKLLLARQILGSQQLVALEITLGARELGDILGLRRGRLIESRLVRARIDPSEQITVPHGLTLREGDFLQLTVHTRSDRDRVVCLHGAEAF